MIDLIAHGINHGIIDGREMIEIPSQSFVAKCEETIKAHPDGRYSPL